MRRRGDNDEEDFSGMEHDLPSSPDGYLRIKDIAKAFMAFIGFAGFLLALNSSYDRLRDWVQTLVQNERVERINQDNKIEQRLDGCCGRRR